MQKRIGALWVRESSNGTKFLTGVLDDLRGEIKIVAFKNDRKEEGSKQPDYNILLSEERPQERRNEEEVDIESISI